MSFADLEMARILEKTRAQSYLEEIDKIVDWAPVEELLKNAFPAGLSPLGIKAYPPLVLLKAVLLQKWYGIDSDPEFEEQINDRLSFKHFIGIPPRQSAPDPSLIARFREQVNPTVMERINGELRQQFSRKVYSIEVGMAGEAGMVKSSAWPPSLERFKEEEEKRGTVEGNPDGDAKPLQFRSNGDSNGKVRDAVPFYGNKEHAAVAVQSGLAPSTYTAKASDHPVKTCPQCGSSRIGRTHFRGLYGKLLKKINRRAYFCKECSWRGTLESRMGKNRKLKLNRIIAGVIGYIIAMLVALYILSNMVLNQ